MEIYPNDRIRSWIEINTEMVQRIYTQTQLKDWFIGKARTVAGYRKNVLANQQQSRDNTIIGKMYFFSYDPKMKEVLPIYDKFPMVFPIERYGDGFLGLNLHYLPLNQRRYLLDMLMGFASNKMLTPSMRLKLSYDLLSSTKYLKQLSTPCVKRYLFSHVRSKFIEILPEEWDRACQIPLELWVIKK